MFLFLLPIEILGIAPIPNRPGVSGPVHKKDPKTEVLKCIKSKSSVE